MVLAGVLTTSIGRSSGQSWEGGPTIFAGIVSDKCVTGPEVGGQTPTVDHFRPLSRFPELAYIWANWNFSCRRCNASKGNQWPELGYINPCADDVAEHPQQYLDYDELTGDIIPKSNIPAPAQRRAWDTIDDLGLNALDVKIHRLECIQNFLNGLVELSVPRTPGIHRVVLGKTRRVCRNN